LGNLVPVQTIYSEGRVTGLGEFSPVRWLFTLAVFLVNKVAYFFGLPFPTTVKLMQ
jgi:hypothetical protein